MTKKTRGPKRQFGERGAAPGQRARKLVADEEKRYTSAHWGIRPTKITEYPDETLMPPKLVQMGELLELHVDTAGKTQGARHAEPTVEIELPPGCHLAFATTEDERVYPVLSPAGKRKMKGLRRRTAVDMPLSEAADIAGGRQCDWTFAPVDVQIIGVLTHVIYRTMKQDDAEADGWVPGEYIHAWGEESGVKPLLCVDADGGLWIAGGNYTVPDEGITD